MKPQDAGAIRAAANLRRLLLWFKRKLALRPPCRCGWALRTTISSPFSCAPRTLPAGEELWVRRPSTAPG